MFPRLLLALTLTAVAIATAPASDLPGVAPGPAKATLDGPRLVMENAVPGQAVPFAVDVEQAFDLAATAARFYVLRTPWKQREPASERPAEAGRPVEFRLSPWEVLVLEAQPMH